MGTRQVPLCWPEPGCSVSGYSSMSLVSASSGHAEGTDTLQSLVILCLQNTPRLSASVAHLGLHSKRVRQDRYASGPVVVNPGGQQSRSWASSSRSQVTMPTASMQCDMPDLGTVVRQRPLAATAVGGDCYSFGYSVVREFG
jgi:hypothetical protein